jgi:hypothetical protein
MGFDFNKIVTVLADEDNIKRGEIALHALHKCGEHVLHRSHEAALILSRMRGGKLATPMGVIGALFPKIPMVVENANLELVKLEINHNKPITELGLALLKEGYMSDGTKTKCDFIHMSVNGNVDYNLIATPNASIMEVSLLKKGYRKYKTFYNNKAYLFWMNNAERDEDGDLTPILAQPLI